MVPGLLRMPPGLGENPAGTELPIGPLLTLLFKRLDGENIRWAVLRNAEGLPGYTRYDVDLLVEPGQTEVFRIVEECAAETGWRCMGRIRKRHYACLLMAKTQPDGGLFFLPLDVFSGLEYRGLRLLETKEVLAARIPNAAGIWHLPPALDAVITLLKEWLPHGVLKENSPRVGSEERRRRSGSVPVMAGPFRRGGIGCNTGRQGTAGGVVAFPRRSADASRGTPASDILAPAGVPACGGGGRCACVPAFARVAGLPGRRGWLRKNHVGPRVGFGIVQAAIQSCSIYSRPCGRAAAVPGYAGMVSPNEPGSPRAGDPPVEGHDGADSRLEVDGSGVVLRRGPEPGPVAVPSLAGGGGGGGGAVEPDSDGPLVCGLFCSAGTSQLSCRFPEGIESPGAPGRTCCFA